MAAPSRTMAANTGGASNRSTRAATAPPAVVASNACAAWGFSAGESGWCDAMNI